MASRPVEPGDPAPDFTLTADDFSKVTLSELRGQPSCWCSCPWRSARRATFIIDAEGVVIEVFRSDELKVPRDASEDLAALQRL
ncbi:MAG: hypothetical protein ACRDU8_09275 [Egibacteraceae bacterium]